jgi:predicted Rossmann fold flavoprotein
MVRPGRKIDLNRRHAGKANMNSDSDMTTCDVLVVGGGAAGLFCAALAGQRGKSVVVLEQNGRVGNKILISGGGRCNFTNTEARAVNYLSERPGFCKSALARFTPEDFIRLVERHRIPYHEKKLGQQFCDRSSRDMVELLLEECRAGQVRIETGCRVLAVRKPDRFEVETTKGRFRASALVVATGGLSFPKLGATAWGYELARQFGLRVTPLRPGLVPLTFRPEEAPMFTPLSGISAEVDISCGDRTFRENLLVTHRGFSGPAVLQISSYWREGEEVEIHLLPGRETAEWLREQRKGGARLEQALSKHLPSRFAAVWSERFSQSDRPIARWTGAELDQVARELARWRVGFAGTEGYGKAEVTVGGVDTAGLSSKTMEAKEVPGLYFIGEVVDVTGWLGGYNFQWAWASAHAAALGLTGED